LAALEARNASAAAVVLHVWHDVPEAAIDSRVRDLVAVGLRVVRINVYRWSERAGEIDDAAFAAGEVRRRARLATW
jgi:hypothetical protein